MLSGKNIVRNFDKTKQSNSITEKPFSLDVLEHMINNSEIFEKLEKINMNQEERDITQKTSEIMTVLENPI